MKLNENGELAAEFESAWSLSATPHISNIKTIVVESKQQRRLTRRQLKSIDSTLMESDHELAETEIENTDNLNSSEIAKEADDDIHITEGEGHRNIEVVNSQTANVLVEGEINIS